MSKKLRTYGMRKEPRIDGVLEWSRSEEGYLEFDGQITKFGDWIITNEEIDKAVLNSEKMFWKLTQSLVIRAGSNQYLFVLSEPVSEAYGFPFDIEFTYSRSFAGKFFNLMLIFGAIYLIILLWSFVAKMVGIE